jgi:hypothetical protein
MTVPAPQQVQVQCPNCQTPLRAQITTLVDAERQPEQKARLLAGQLNAAACPNCGYPLVLGAPLLYHDAAKQLFLVHFPQQLGARPEEQERFIGDATQLFLRNLPADAPRGYLLAPRRFLTLNSLVDTVLEADGISREVIEAQRARVELIARFAEAYEQGDETFAALVEAERAQIDQELFTTLATFIDAGRQSGREDSVQVLAELFGALADAVGLATEGAATEDDLAQALERFAEASDDEFPTVVAELRPIIDYEFYDALTSRIDTLAAAGDTAEAERLTARRAQSLDLIAQMDAEAQALFEAGTTTLRTVLEAPDALDALRAAKDQINDAFLLVIDANLAAADRGGQRETVERLLAIRNLAAQVVEESLTPEDRFITQLLGAETPREATSLLRSNFAQITPVLVRRLNEVADDMAKAGRTEQADTARRLAREAGAMLF